MTIALTATPAFAAPDPTTTTTTTTTTVPGAPPTLGQVVENARAWVIGLLFAVATLFFVVGGIRYVMAGGDPGEVERAKLTLKSALAGYALALLAPAVLTALRGIVGGG